MTPSPLCMFGTFLEAQSLKRGPAATVGAGEPKARSEPDPASALGNGCWWGFVRQVCGTLRAREVSWGSERAWGLKLVHPGPVQEPGAVHLPSLMWVGGGGWGLAAGAAT